MPPPTPTEIRIFIMMLPNGKSKMQDHKTVHRVLLLLHEFYLQFKLIFDLEKDYSINLNSDPNRKLDFSILAPK